MREDAKLATSGFRNAITLDEWRRLPRSDQPNGLTYRELGERLGVGPTTVMRWCRRVGETDYRLPGPDAMRAICLETRFAVQPNSFYPLAEWHAELPPSEAGDNSDDCVAAVGATVAPKENSFKVNDLADDGIAVVQPARVTR